MKILFAAAEVVPFAKTGGLADVVGALPSALHGLGHEVRVIMPRYRAVDITRFGLRKVQHAIQVPMGTATVTIDLLETVLPHTRIPVYFVDCPSLFDRDSLYQDQGRDFPDNLKRFSVFCQAILKAIPTLGWQPDVVHCHDWHTTLLCAHLAFSGANDPSWASVATVLTVHNLSYQGVFPKGAWPMTNLSPRASKANGVVFRNKINCLKGGLVYADLVSTVSPTYAKEIRSATFGCGLERVLRQRGDEVVGILNGIDPQVWNPSTDPHLPARYTRNALAGKAACKAALQEQYRLPKRPGLLIGMIQRLAEQKGIDLFVEAAPALFKLPVQVVMLGTGEPVYHKRLAALSKRFPEHLAVALRFDNPLAHLIEAGADVFLMPSKFEPCGLNQMYSMRYGTVPIVRRVGGLADTVVDTTPATLHDGTATGYVWKTHSAKALVETVRRALKAFDTHKVWTTLMRQGMRQDFSWNRSAQEYVELYTRALTKKRSSTPQAGVRKRSR